MILTINSGSSSIKAAIYASAAGLLELQRRIHLSGIASVQGRFRVDTAEDLAILDQTEHLPDHPSAFARLFDWLTDEGTLADLQAVGHRIVHGGNHYTAPTRVTPEVIERLRNIIDYDPLHLPAEIAGMEQVESLRPGIPQVACFDTAFHASLPVEATTLPLPARFREGGVRRYGFHGLSYESIVEQLREIAPGAAAGRLVIAHLGSGASLAAIRGGKCVDTTMGFTPVGGLMMGTRPGDLDPGVLVYLARTYQLSPEELEQILYFESGLRGVSGRSGDLRELLDQPVDSPSGLAVRMFCHQARKWIGAMIASLGGLDNLVFTAGIGEHAAAIRAQICQELAALGIELDDQANQAQSLRISPPDAPVEVWVIPTDEEGVIARHSAKVMGIPTKH